MDNTKNPPQIYYYGCMEYAGHYWWESNSRQLLGSREPAIPHPDTRKLPSLPPQTDRSEGLGTAHPLDPL